MTDHSFLQYMKYFLHWKDFWWIAKINPQNQAEYLDGLQEVTRERIWISIWRITVYFDSFVSVHYITEHNWYNLAWCVSLLHTLEQYLQKHLKLHIFTDIYFKDQ